MPVVYVFDWWTDKIIAVPRATFIRLPLADWFVAPTGPRAPLWAYMGNDDCLLRLPNTRIVGFASFRRV